MKALIHYQPPKESDIYEGARLRKTLKGACEIDSISWVDNLLAYPDLAHFISPNDEKLVNRTDDDGIKIVYSAGYCENDPHARLYDYPLNGEPIISPKSLRCLNKASLVLCPNEPFLEKLKKDGVTAPMKILIPFVNLKRFEFTSNGERDIFKRYFGVKDEDRFVVVTGDYAEKNNLALLKNIALGAPEVRFFFFGSAKRGFGNYMALRKLNKKAPKNLSFSPLLEDDVYRSALANACCYLLLDNEHPDCESLLDAFAARTQVVAFGKQVYNPFLKDRLNCYKAQSAEEASSIIFALSQGSLKATIIAGYQEAEKHSLDKQAAKLKTLYSLLLNGSQAKEDSQK